MIRDDAESVRLFIGVPLSLRSLRAVANAASDLKERSTSSNFDMRWVAPARYHITLAYLGWSKPEVVPAIQDVVGRALVGQKPFEMRCAELGAFPSLEKAQVLWVGAGDRMGELVGLAKKVSCACAELGFTFASREFHPHVTMARIKGEANLVKLAQESPAHVFSKSLVESLILYKSSVESDASEYEKIAHWSLGPPSE
ncbi:MAG: RNA 2',3'-cyclic phosphodiesterase [Myxococcales bacterium]|nr:RNA 2',3'-cyclic phosphodiesterase [Myxococcales bacterium]